MAGVGRSSPAPLLLPVAAGNRGPSGRLALGLFAAVLVSLVGVSLVGRTGDGLPGSQAAAGAPTLGPTTTAVATASASTTPAAPPSPTASPEPPPGTPPPRVNVPIGAVPACPPGSTPDEPGPVDQARPPLAFVTPMAFDRRAGRIVILVDGYDAASRQTWTFDVCTNTWTRMHPKREPSGWDQLVYDVDTDVTITVDSTTQRVWVYDLGADTWTVKGIAPMALQQRPRLVYDPLSGLVVVRDQSELWTYDVETDEWSRIRLADAPAGGPYSGREVLAYDASVDRLVSYDDGPDATRLLDIRTGTWSTSSAAAPDIGFGWGPTGGEIAYDEAAERTVVFSRNRMIAYDAAGDGWEVLVAGDDPDHPGGLTGRTVRAYHTMVYDPVNERLVVYGGQYPTSELDGNNPWHPWVQADDVLTFDPAAGEWSVLLEASVVQRAPS